MSACENEADIKIKDSEQKQTINDGIIKLGKKLKNPYSVANMKEAYKNLVKQEVKNAKPVGVTDADIDLLFKKYEEVL
jgi:uncharacterized protein YaaR (DUF327 family)